jgi:hypothetical protein
MAIFATKIYNIIISKIQLKNLFNYYKYIEIIKVKLKNIYLLILIDIIALY